jgi:hypothetical protein
MTMIHSIHSKTCTEAWLSAVTWLAEQEGHTATNLLLEIATPALMTDSDQRVVNTVDAFLRKHQQLPVVTVAGTIFPAGLYSQHGPAGIYKVYPDEVYPKVKEGWGTYAYRFVRRTGANGTVMNPLETLVEKMKKQLTHTSTLGRAYELNSVEVFADLPLYEATQDSNRGINHPCLSHVSFRIDHKKVLAMTALYRSHFYIQKALGNLLGLAQLQSFIAQETNLSVGPMVIHSIYAVLDRAQGKWGKQEILKLIANSKKASEIRAA